jgi:hypothetical protein
MLAAWGLLRRTCFDQRMLVLALHFHLHYTLGHCRAVSNRVAFEHTGVATLQRLATRHIAATIGTVTGEVTWLAQQMALVGMRLTLHWEAWKDTLTAEQMIHDPCP